MRPFPAILTILLATSCATSMTDHGPHGDDAEARPTAPPNLALPTLGGKQLWADRRWREGWRVQHNVLTGHHRLLDDGDVRRAWGSLPACTEELDRQAPRSPAPKGHLVVLLHGMGRSHASLDRLEARLRGAGYAVAAISYASTRRSIEEHADSIEELLNHLEGYGRVSFVTHSLGGLVARVLSARRGPWREALAIERIVMLGPPNQGSALAEDLEGAPPYRWLLGETGRGLTPREVAKLPVPQTPVLVIAGGRGDGEGWNPFLAGDDDGLVRVAETHLEGEAAHLVVRCPHTFLMNDATAIDAALDFLGAP